MAKEEKVEVDFGGEEGATTGYYRHGQADTPEEESLTPEEEPGTKEATDEGGEEESELEEEEEEPGDEETEEDEFGLPKVSEALEAERKELLKMVSNKMKGVGALKIKAQLVDAIHTNPGEVIPMLAQRYGIQLAGGEAESEDEEIKFEQVDLAPQKDEELHSYVGRLIQANLQPVLKALSTKKAPKAAPKAAPRAAGTMMEESDLETAINHLNEKYTDWGIYEDRMVELIKTHRSLLRDPDELYRIAKATSVNLSDLKKAKKTAKGKKSVKRSTKVVKISTAKGKKLSVGEAWELAKQTLRG